MERFIFSNTFQDLSGHRHYYIKRHNIPLITNQGYRTQHGLRQKKSQIAFDYKWFNQQNLSKRGIFKNISDLTQNDQKYQLQNKQNKQNGEDLFGKWKKKNTIHSNYHNQTKTADRSLRKKRLFRQINTPSVGTYQLPLNMIAPKIVGNREIKENTSNMIYKENKKKAKDSSIKRKIVSSLKNSKKSTVYRENNVYKNKKNNYFNKNKQVKHHTCPLSDGEIQKIWLQKLNKYNISLKDLPNLFNSN